MRIIKAKLYKQPNKMAGHCYTNCTEKKSIQVVIKKHLIN